MLFYVQMRWNYQGRISQEKLWDLEALEGEHGVAGIRSGFVQLFKVVSQHRIIAIVRTESLEDLDRNSMGWLPMREYLEFEQIWALRDYEGFLEDVRAKFPPPGDQGKSLTNARSTASTREVASAWFRDMEEGKFDMSLISNDVIWDNIPPTQGLSDVAPWLGSYRGLPAVLKSFDVWAKFSKMLKAQLVGELVIEGARAVGIVHEHAQCLANKNEYDLYVATFLTVQAGKIAQWRVFWDPSPLLKAYSNRS